MKHKVLNIPQGYSLIELTIVVGLISILSIAISAVVLATIVNSTRVKNQVRTRQAGDYAVGQIRTMIRNAREVTLCESASNRLNVENIDGGTTLLFLENGQIASNSGTHLTSTDTTITNFSLTCLPSDSEPKLVNLSFTVGPADGDNLRTIENTLQRFSTSIELRNE